MGLHGNIGCCLTKFQSTSSQHVEKNYSISEKTSILKNQELLSALQKLLVSCIFERDIFCNLLEKSASFVHL